MSTRCKLTFQPILVFKKMNSLSGQLEQQTVSFASRVCTQPTSSAGKDL